ncbi:hypothetical protein [Yonghaparkia sp. Root332]|uniref:hypothetical protein n=1 Tax=Yonghaparkia sp. Root332 TaxID=1736516 RepID=UPI0006F244F9|nr:hypothetical protein [Yonghaparkia sp. Root332]KQV26609.1 hypothetical protein ASC54_07065 [Yonghaparkia sp. Root332]
MADERTPNEDPTEPLRPVSGADAAGDAPTEAYDAVDAGDAPTRAFTRPLDQPGAVPPVAPTPPPPTAPTEIFRPAGVGAAAGVGAGLGAGAAAGAAAGGFPRSSAPIGGGPAAGPAPASSATESRRLSGGAIALIVLAVILLIALVVLIFALLNRDDAPAPAASDTPSTSASPSDTPSPSPTPSETEEPSPSPTPTESSAAPEPAPAPTFTVFQAENTANCPDESGSVPLFWSWSIDGATNAWFGIGTDDARAEPFEEVPTTATYEFAYQCSEESQLYTVSAENADGLVTHQTVEVVRLLP